MATMTKKKCGSSQQSKRAREHNEMLETALARPGVREVMEVFRAWRAADQQLDSYRSAATTPEKISTTNNSSSV